jgi:glycosyltransferase involved in cell wall biosynthesis
VIIPIKDERDNLVPLVEQLLRFFESREESRSLPFEILFVDDGSTDGSSALLAQVVARHSPVRALYFDRNYGKTAALDAGFRQALSDVVVIMDGDLQNQAADIATLLQALTRYDVVCGRRMVRQDHLVRRVSSRLANAVRAAVIRDGVHDTGCEFMAFRRRVIERLPLFEGMHRFLPALALMHGFTVTEVPVHHYPRLHGRSKYGIGNRLFKSLYDMLAVRWMKSRCLRYRFRADAVPAEAALSSSHPGSSVPHV